MMLHLRQLLQLRFPTQSSFFNLSRAQEILKSQMYVPKYFFEELNMWDNSAFSQSKEVRLKIPVINNITEKDIDMKKMQAKRLKEVNQKKREEKMKQDIQKLEIYKDLLDGESLSKSKLRQHGFKNEAELIESIKNLEEKINERRLKCQTYFCEMENWDDDSDNELRLMSFDEVEIKIKNLEDEKANILDKNHARQSKKSALNKRKSYASKERMRILNQLAKSSNNSTTSRSSKSDDTFGMKDSDWEVYKYINKDATESDEEQDQERLNEIEQSLSQMQLMRNQLMVKLGQAYDYLPLRTERILIPEILFQPSIAGNEQEGITGMIQYVLKNYDHNTQNHMVKNILITGGTMKVKGFKARLEAEIMSILPFQSKFNVFQSNSSDFDAWYGAREFVNAIEDINKYGICKSDYDEYGLGYLQEHSCSNVYVPLKI